MISEQLNSNGTCSFVADETTPQRMRDLMRERRGRIWVTPRMGVSQATCGQLDALDQVLYAGTVDPVFNADRTISLTGVGLSWWAGDPDGVGPHPSTGVFEMNGNLASAVTAINALDTLNGMSLFTFGSGIDSSIPWWLPVYRYDQQVPSLLHQMIHWADLTVGAKLEWFHGHPLPPRVIWVEGQVGIPTPRVLATTEVDHPVRADAAGLVALPASVVWDRSESDLVTRVCAVDETGAERPTNLASSLRPRRLGSSEPADLSFWPESRIDAGTESGSSAEATLRAAAMRRSLTDKDLLSVTIRGAPGDGELRSLLNPGEPLLVWAPHHCVVGDGSMIITVTGHEADPMVGRIMGVEWGVQAGVGGPHEVWFAPNAAQADTDPAHPIGEWVRSQANEVKVTLLSPQAASLSVDSGRLRVRNRFRVLEPE